MVASALIAYVLMAVYCCLELSKAPSEDPGMMDDQKFRLMIEHGQRQFAHTAFRLYEHHDLPEDCNFIKCRFVIEDRGELGYPSGTQFTGCQMFLDEEVWETYEEGLSEGIYWKLVS